MLETVLTTFDDSQLSPEAVKWFERQMRGGRLPNEEYIEAEEMPEWQRIADDLRNTTAIELKVAGYPNASMAGATQFEITIDGIDKGSFSNPYDETDPEVSLAHFADLLCEQHLHEEVWGGWPTCPVHQTHPLDPGMKNEGVASWICPADAVSIRIGSLTK